MCYQNFHKFYALDEDTSTSIFGTDGQNKLTGHARQEILQRIEDIFKNADLEVPAELSKNFSLLKNRERKKLHERKVNLKTCNVSKDVTTHTCNVQDKCQMPAYYDEQKKVSFLKAEIVILNFLCAFYMHSMFEFDDELFKVRNESFMFF